MSLSPSQTRIALDHAAALLRAKSGRNPRRLADEVADEFDLDEDDALAALTAEWAALNEDAGLGPLVRVSFGPDLPGYQTTDLRPRLAELQARPRAVLSPRQLAAAGTQAAREHQIGKDLFAVHGPEFWDLPPHHELRNRRLFRLITAPLVRWDWVLDDGTRKLRGICGAEVEALTRGDAPALRPGDALVNGGGGDPSHVCLYEGKDERGRPTILHAMATNKEGASARERRRDALRLPLTGSLTGVLRERLGDFFDRYHRDTVVVLRLPGLDDEQIERGLRRAGDFLGAPYDYKLSPGDDAIYCTELYLEYWKAALGGLRLPYAGTSYHEGGTTHGVIGVKAFICEPSHLLVSPHVELGAALGGGAAAVETMFSTHVLGPGAARTL